MGNTITALPINLVGDSYGSYTPDALSTYPADMPTFSGPAYNVTSTAASPSSGSSWTNISNLINTLGATAAGVYRQVSGSPTPVGTTGSSVSGTATGSSSTFSLIVILLVAGLAFFLLGGGKK
jgi:hypothetical protein